MREAVFFLRVEKTLDIAPKMSGVSNLGKALTFVFIFSLLALLSQLLYVLYRRRHRHQPQTGDRQPAGVLLTSDSSSSKKDLLYLFCFKTQSRVEPDGSAPTRGEDGSSPDDQTDAIDLFKLREMYGPSRVLFTIKEEEKDELESEKSITRSRNMSQSFDETGTSPEFVVMTIEEDVDETPFSTPCDSPLYFTPSASPVHQIMVGETT